MTDAEKKIMSNTEPKIFMIEPDSYKMDMVMKMLEGDKPSLPLIKLSDMDEKFVCPEDVLEELRKRLDGKWHPCGSHTVKNIIEDIHAG